MVYCGTVAYHAFWRVPKVVTPTLDTSDKLVAAYGTACVVNGYSGPLIQVKRLARTGSPVGDGYSRIMYANGPKNTVSTTELKAFADQIGTTGIDVYVTRLYNQRRTRSDVNKSALVENASATDPSTRIYIVRNNVPTNYMEGDQRESLAGSTYIFRSLQSVYLDPIKQGNYSMFTMYSLSNGSANHTMDVNMLSADSMALTQIYGSISHYLNAGGVYTISPTSTQLASIGTDTDVIYSQYDAVANSGGVWINNNTKSVTGTGTSSYPTATNTFLQLFGSTYIKTPPDRIRMYVGCVYSKQLTAQNRTDYNAFLKDLYV